MRAGALDQKVDLVPLEPWRHGDIGWQRYFVQADDTAALHALKVGVLVLPGLPVGAETQGLVGAGNAVCQAIDREPCQDPVQGRAADRLALHPVQDLRACYRAILLEQEHQDPLARARLARPHTFQERFCLSFYCQVRREHRYPHVVNGRLFCKRIALKSHFTLAQTPQLLQLRCKKNRCCRN
jgi:hypothetical protein